MVQSQPLAEISALLPWAEAQGHQRQSQLNRERWMSRGISQAVPLTLSGLGCLAGTPLDAGKMHM